MIFGDDSYFVETGTVVIPAGRSDLVSPIQLGIEDSRFEPVITVTPFTRFDTGRPPANSNVNVHLDTTVEFNSSTGRWEFNIHRSIGSSSPTNTEQQEFMWKAIAIRHVRQVGTIVSPDTE